MKTLHVSFWTGSRRKTLLIPESLLERVLAWCEASDYTNVEVRYG
jgi:hypothetical protein